MSKHPATEISRALQETELPSTEKVAEVLEKTKIDIEEQGKQASYFSGERKLAKDAAEFVEATKEFIQEKNQGEVIQQLVKDTGMASQELADTFQNYNFFLNRDQMISMRIQAKDYSRLAQERLNAMRTLAITLVNSPEFRQLLSDMSQLIQDTFRAEVQKAPSTEVDTSKPVEQLTEEAKAKAMETTEFGKKVVSDIREGKLPVPEERKQAVQQRFKDILRKLSADANYKSSVDGLISIMDQIQFHLSQIAEQTKETIQEKKFAYGTATNKMFSDLKIFISQFTGEHALNLLYEDLNKLFQLTTNDQRINHWFWDMRHFLIEVLRNPEVLDKEEFNTRWNDLYNRGNEIYYDENFNKAWYAVSFDFQDCMNNIRNDTLTQRVATDASKLARDLFLDTSGQPSLAVMQTGLTNLRNLVLPIIKKNLDNVPVGPLQSSDETYDWIVENLYLNAKEIVPDHIEIKVWGKADISLAEQPSKAVSYITMWIRNFHLDARDIKFHFRRKGLLKLEEKGIADVNLTGRNVIRITWRVESDQKGGWIFGVEQVKCYLDDLDITIKESTHTFLMKLVTSLFSGSIRSAVEDKVEKGIAESLVTINDKMNDTLLGLGI